MEKITPTHLGHYAVYYQGDAQPQFSPLLPILDALDDALLDHMQQDAIQKGKLIRKVELIIIGECQLYEKEIVKGKQFEGFDNLKGEKVDEKGANPEEKKGDIS